MEIEEKQKDVPTNEDEHMNYEEMKAVVICRGYIIYAKSDNDELYDFFYPAMQRRISISEAETLIPDNHKLLTTERVTRNYEIPMSIISQYGKIIH